MASACQQTQVSTAGSQRAGPRRPRPEVADIFRRHGEAYRRAHRPPPAERQVMEAIELCRTCALGGHVERCDACGFERIAYNSCRNRHCPKCQALVKARWLEARRAELLPVAYFHVVFTLTHALNPLALANKTVVYNLLFQCAAETLKEFGADPRHRLGGKVGFTTLLHTWDQRLNYHVHLHCVVPGGALSPDGTRWVPARDDYLFPVKALSRVFRGKFIERLNRALADGQLARPGELATERGWRRLIDSLWETDWVVYCKKPFGGPEKVLDYLGRYTHRVAIANSRILDVDDARVTFRYRDRRDGDRVKVCTLAPDEFIRRFLLHVLPKGFVRIRHYGFLASRSKARDLARCRRALGLSAEIPKPAKKTTHELLLQLTGVDPTACPCCKHGTMRRLQELPKHPPRLTAPPRSPP